MIINPGLRRFMGSLFPSDYTLYLPFSSSLGTGATWSRTTNAWNPETGAVASHNLLTYSQDFTNLAWTKLNLVPTNTSVIAPDGSATGQTFTTSGAASAQRIYHSTTGSTGSNTFSVYAKAGTASYIQILHGSDAAMYANFDLANGVTGTVGAKTTATITSVGGSWYRCSITINVASTANYNIYIIPSSTSGYGAPYTATVAHLDAWGAQLNAYSLTDYVPTTSAAVYTPRYVTGKSGTGLFLERSATNLFTYSQDFSNSAWKTYSLSQTTGATAPDGVSLSSLIYPTSTGSSRYLNQLNISATGVMTMSAYVKAAGKNVVWGYIQNGATYGIVYFDLSSQTIQVTAGSSQTPTGAISAVSGATGWYRISVTSGGSITLSGAAGQGFGVADAKGSLTATTNGTDGVYIWGAQLEANPYVTSYMPTTSATTTRGAESDSYNTSGIISTSGSTIAGWWKPEAIASGTVQTIWSSYTDASNYTALKYNGVIAYIEKAKTGQTTEYVTYAITLPTTSFTHFAILINADGTMGLYVNGVSASAGLGSELITNAADRDFSSDTGFWSKNSWTYNGTSHTMDISSGANLSGFVRANLSLSYKIHMASFDIPSYTSGSLSWRVGGSFASTTYSATGSGLSNVIIGGLGSENTGIYCRSAGTTASVDNLSLKEIYNSTSTAFAPVIASTMQVGSINGGSQGDGTLDEFYFYNRVLTLDDITKLYLGA